MSVIAFFIYLFIFFMSLHRCVRVRECASAITLGSSAKKVTREEHLQVHCDERRPGRSEGPCVTMGWGTMGGAMGGILLYPSSSMFSPIYIICIAVLLWLLQPLSPALVIALWML